jgi:hypothetical protein
MGIVYFYQLMREDTSYSATLNLGLSYYSISLSLNVFLTLMIVTRLVLHSRNIRNAMGAPAGNSGLYKAVITMLIESCALYAVTLLLFIVPWAVDWFQGIFSPVPEVSFPILFETQVRFVSAFFWPARILGHGGLIVVINRPSPYS